MWPNHAVTIAVEASAHTPHSLPNAFAPLVFVAPLAVVLCVPVVCVDPDDSVLALVAPPDDDDDVVDDDVDDA